MNECSNFGLNWPYQVNVELPDKVYPMNPHHTVFASESSIRMKYADSGYLMCVGVIIDTSTTKIIAIPASATAVKMVNEAGTALLPMGASINNPINPGPVYQGTYNQFEYGILYVIPNDVKKVFVGCILNSSVYPKSLSIGSNKPLTIIGDDYSVGTFADKPAQLEQGLGYYATDRNKLVFYNNTNNKFYDAAGNEVS